MRKAPHGVATGSMTTAPVNQSLGPALVGVVFLATCTPASPLLSLLDSIAYRQDHVADLLLRLDVPRRVDHLLERIAPVDDRAVLSGLDQLFQEQHVFLRVARRDGEDHLLVSEGPGPGGEEEGAGVVGRAVPAGPLSRC